MRREYIFGQKAEIIYLFREGRVLEDAYSAIPLLDRIGDTESLVSPINWNIYDVKVVEDVEVELNTVTRASFIEKIQEGAFSVVKAYLTPIFKCGEWMWPSSPIADSFYVPIRAVTISREGLTLLEPSTLKVKLARGCKVAEFESSAGIARVAFPKNPVWVG